VKRRPSAPYSTVEVCRLTGLSFRRLDYWDRTGLLRPSVHPAGGSGGQGRLYSQNDLDRLLLIKKLLDLGVSLQRIRADRDPRITAERLRAALVQELVRAS
jgi:DNA-binding transcriptional MerR regulator